MGHYVKLFIFYAFYYARSEILQKWRLPHIPTVSSWRATMDTALLMYKKLSYASRNLAKKFKIWSDWIDSWGLANH